MTDTPVVSILLFSRAIIKTVHKLTNKIFGKTVRNLSFFFLVCKPRIDKVFETFDKNFMGLTSRIFVGQSQDAPSLATSPSSKIIFQRINEASVRKRTLFSFL